MTSIRIPKPWELVTKHTTSERVYYDRRQILRGLGLGMGAAAIGWSPSSPARADEPVNEGLTRPALGKRYADRFPAPRNGTHKGFSDRRETPEALRSQYNNFYEFTTVKDQVWEVGQGFSVDPWRIAVRGLVKRQRTIDLDDIFTRFPLEERLYRFRCVERWSAQVPWTGFPLGRLIDWLEPLPSARFVRFVSHMDKARMPGIGEADWYPWPYYEALRLDEARHDLAFAVVGIYGHGLPIQHGAPWRIVMPWKYGYKSAKSIVSIEFTKDEPSTFWNDTQPEEYGFFSNVDPGRPHPRWSQRFETDIGTQEARQTLLLNGYSAALEGLYDGSEI